MPNEYHNRQIADLPNPKSGSGVKPLPAGKPGSVDACENGELAGASG
jgi:hypothetical protein